MGCYYGAVAVNVITKFAAASAGIPLCQTVTGIVTVTGVAAVAVGTAMTPAKSSASAGVAEYFTVTVAPEPLRVSVPQSVFQSLVPKV